MEKVSLSHSQLAEKLGRKLRSLDGACRRFDAGNDDEIEQIALILRTLWHKGRSAPLMDKLKFSSTLLDATYKCPPERIWSSGEVEGAGQQRAYWTGGLRTYAPAFLVQNEMGGQWLGFDDWWCGEVVRNSTGTVFSRKDIVMLVADKEAAHVDSELTPEQYGLRFEAILPIVPLQELPDGTFVISKSSPVPFIIRHIAFEVLKSLVVDYGYDGSRHYQYGIAFMTMRLSRRDGTDGENSSS